MYNNVSSNQNAYYISAVQWHLLILVYKFFAGSCPFNGASSRTHNATVEVIANEKTECKQTNQENGPLGYWQ